jgi:hypothetical protein
MPRALSPLLSRCLERANPNVATFVELSAPDAGKILRRAADQFLTAPTLVSMAPAASAVASNAGGLTLASTPQALISLLTGSTGPNIPQEDPRRYMSAVKWAIDPAFGGAILRRVTVQVKFLSALNRPNLKLDIRRAHATAGVLQRQVGSSIVETAQTQYSFASLLKEPIFVKAADLAIDGSGFATVVFDLANLRLAIDPTTTPPPGPGQTGDLPALYFTVQTDQMAAGNLVEWRKDIVTSRTAAGVGTFSNSAWNNANPDDPASIWVETVYAEGLSFKLEVEQYSATSQAVYALTLPTVPQAASEGRIAFGAGVPAGTAAALELSTAGAGGPFTEVAHGDLVTVRQTTYHARLTMTASADQRRAPVVSSLGLEFRGRTDLSAESTVEPLSQEVALPFLAASIGEGSVSIVRAGRRDYRDVGSDLATATADTQLEVDVYLGSRHPAVTRKDWFHAARASVSSRQPTPTQEILSLLSMAKTLKRKIPGRVESINAVHTVTSASLTQISVTPQLVGVTAAGNEYDGRGYYLRVRKSTQTGIETGTVATIAGNTGLSTLDFVQLTGTLIAGDEIEVHSARYVQPSLSWANRDPADIWWEIFTLHLLVPSDRIGRSDVGTAGRAGLPPRVTDRAPGDAATQAKLLVTLKLSDAETGDTLIDQLSFIMGGATIEIAGQFVFRQIYPLRDAAGRITVAPDPVAAVFDARDYTGLDAPTGREQRITVLSCDYGVDTVGVAQQPASTANYVDADALAELGTQDIEGLGTAVIPSEIARWCYNTADAGLFLASALAQQVVLATGTGLRAWPWTTVDAHPQLTVGDTVILITDQYTDWDPARRAPVRGWNAYPLTLVSVAAGGRRFRGFLQGLAGVTGVELRGGVGALRDTDPSSDRAGLNDLRETDTDTTHTIRFTPGAAVREVWAGYRIVTAPESDADWDLVKAGMTPLPAGATSFTVPQPSDAHVVLLQLDPRLSDLAAGPSVRRKVTATPQPPTWELDDGQTATTGTQWLKLTERGIPVASVQLQTQIGTAFSGWGPPTRGPCAAGRWAPENTSSTSPGARSGAGSCRATRWRTGRPPSCWARSSSIRRPSRTS